MLGEGSRSVSSSCARCVRILRKPWLSVPAARAPVIEFNLSNGTNVRVVYSCGCEVAKVNRSPISALF